MHTADQNRDYVLRIATPADVKLIAQQRAAMFRDMGVVPRDEFDLLRNACVPSITDLMAKGRYIGWFLEVESVPVAGGGVILWDAMPGPGCYRVGRLAHIVNIYTDPNYRRRGLARRLMQIILEWCAANRMDQVTLGASDQGRPLYESLGFKPTSHMKIADSEYREYFRPSTSNDEQ